MCVYESMQHWLAGWLTSPRMIHVLCSCTGGWEVGWVGEEGVVAGPIFPQHMNDAFNQFGGTVG